MHKRFLKEVMEGLRALLKALLSCLFAAQAKSPFAAAAQPASPFGGASRSTKQPANPFGGSLSQKAFTEPGNVYSDFEPDLGIEDVPWYKSIGLTQVVCFLTQAASFGSSCSEAEC